MGDGKVTRLPDDSAFFTASMPLPKDHWLYADDGAYEPPPMGMRTGTYSPRRKVLEKQIRDAARYAVRSATDNGKIEDYDPDSMVQNMVVGLLGYFTPDGLSEDKWANPPEDDDADTT